MTSRPHSRKSPRDIFARTILALQPYSHDIVLIGGWVHALYLTDVASLNRPVYTDDIDISIPRTLFRAGRPTLIELATEAGFERDECLEDIEGTPIRLTQSGPGGAVIDLDVITEGNDPRTAVPIEGQPNLAAQGYPGQHVLLDNAQWIAVGTAVHASLDPAIRIRVPTLGAYVLHKGLSFATRSRLDKMAKDLVYLVEILRDPVLGQGAREQVHELAQRYPSEFAQWRQNLTELPNHPGLLRLVAAQLVIGGQAMGSEAEVSASVRATVLRALAGPVAKAI